MRESVAAAAKLPLAQAAEQEIAVLEQLLKQFPSAVHWLPGNAKPLNARTASHPVQGCQVFMARTSLKAGQHPVY